MKLCNFTKLNNHDKALIKEAELLDNIEWYLVKEDEAETKEGYKKLHSIRTRLYHKEEYNANML